MSYKIEFPNSLDELKIFYLVKDIKIIVPSDYLQYIVSEKVLQITGNKEVYTIQDLSDLSPEEYFQYSLIYDSPFPLEMVLKIMQVAKEYEYNFFQVKTVLLKEGIIE